MSTIEQRKKLFIISDDIANECLCTVNEIMGRRRIQRIADARHVAMWIAVRHLGFTTTDTGRIFGGRDHSTVIHACQRIDGYRAKPESAPPGIMNLIGVGLKGLQV